MLRPFLSDSGLTADPPADQPRLTPLSDQSVEFRLGEGSELLSTAAPVLVNTGIGEGGSWVCWRFLNSTTNRYIPTQLAA